MVAASARHFSAPIAALQFLCRNDFFSLRLSQRLDHEIIGSFLWDQRAVDAQIVQRVGAQTAILDPKAARQIAVADDCAILTDFRIDSLFGLRVKPSTRKDHRGSHHG